MGIGPSSRYSKATPGRRLAARRRGPAPGSRARSPLRRSPARISRLTRKTTGRDHAARELAPARHRGRESRDPGPPGRRRSRSRRLRPGRHGTRSRGPPRPPRGTADRVGRDVPPAPGRHRWARSGTRAGRRRTRPPRRLGAAGDVRFEPCHRHRAVGPDDRPPDAIDAGLRASRTGRSRTARTWRSTRASGESSASAPTTPRCSSASPGSVTRRAPLLGQALRRSGGIPLRPLMAQALLMGDEMHQRNVAASSLLARALLPALCAERLAHRGSAASRRSSAGTTSSS